MDGEKDARFLLDENFGGAYAAALRDRLLTLLRESSVVCLDFSQVKFMDTIGLGVLVTVQKYAVSRGGVIKLQKMTEEIYCLFERTRLVNAFYIERNG
jgi:anti-sigma B factor antagonist